MSTFGPRHSGTEAPVQISRGLRGERQTGELAGLIHLLPAARRAGFPQDDLRFWGDSKQAPMRRHAQRLAV